MVKFCLDVSFFLLYTAAGVSYLSASENLLATLWLGGAFIWMLNSITSWKIWKRTLRIGELERELEELERQLNRLQ